MAVLAAVASSCGGESESKQQTSAAGAAFAGQKAVEVAPGLMASLTNSSMVNCPALGGSKVIGAGAQIISPNVPTGSRKISGITPYPNLNGVLTVGHTVGNVGGSWAITSVAVCARPPHGLELVSATAPPTGSAANATVNCSAGKKVLGTGAQINGNNQNEITIGSIAPNANLGGVSADAVEIGAGANANWALKVWAICATAPPSHELVTANTPNDSSSPKNKSVVCPAGKLVSGAGVKITSNTLNAIVITGMVPSLNLSGVSVFASETGAGTNNNWSLTAYAICV